MVRVRMAEPGDEHPLAVSGARTVRAVPAHQPALHPVGWYRLAQHRQDAVSQAGTATSTSFWTCFPHSIGPLPPCTRRVLCSTRKRCSSSADWALESDGVTNLGLQVQLALISAARNEDPEAFAFVLNSGQLIDCMVAQAALSGGKRHALSAPTVVLRLFYGCSTVALKVALVRPYPS